MVRKIKQPSSIILLLLLASSLILPGTVVQAQISSSMTIPNGYPIVMPAFSTLGFNIRFTGDNNQNGEAQLQYRQSGSSMWQEGHPPQRVWHATSFHPNVSGSQYEWAGRLFQLKPGTSYEIQVRFSDPDGVLGQNPFQFTASTRTEPRTDNSGRVIHVSPDGQDSNEGSAGAPLGTIQKAIELVNPGETILLHSGSFNISSSNSIRIDKSGTPENPIIIKSAPGEQPILEGANPELAIPGNMIWQETDRATYPGVYWAPLSTSPSLVFFEEHFLMPFDSISNLATGLYQGDTRTGLHGGWWYDGNSDRLYLKFPTVFDQWSGSAVNPTGTSVYAGLARYGLIIGGDHIVVDGLTIQHTRTAIQLDSADYAIVRNNILRWNWDGVRAYTSLSRSDDDLSSFSLIEGNDIYCSPSFWYREWWLGHDVISTGGIGFASGGSHVIRNNKIHDVENGIFAGSPWGDGGPATMGNPRYNAGTVIMGNELYQIGDDALELDGPVYNQVIWGNRLHHILVGISSAPATVGPLWMVRNTIYLTNRYFPDGSIDLTGKYIMPHGAWKYNVNASGGTGPTLLYHNSSVVELDPASPINSISAFSHVWSNTPGFIAKTRNNSWSVNPGRAVLTIYKDQIESNGHPVEINMDYDNLWVDRTVESAYLARILSGDRMYTIEELRQSYGLEQHGISVLPEFSNPSSGNFNVPGSSPLVDAGVHLPGINDTYSGIAPDIGAVEFNGPSPTFVDVPFDHWAHDYIEALYQAGYVAGCSSAPLLYCPDTTMTRAESAVFIERGIHGAATLPPNSGTQVFDDVPLWEWFAKWATALWDDGYTAGCGIDPLVYCPLQGHTRAEGSVFFLRMLNGADFVPPEPSGLFADVPIDMWYADWVEAAYTAGLIPACETSPELKFCPYGPLDRAMAAYMMVEAKGWENP